MTTCFQFIQADRTFVALGVDAIQQKEPANDSKQATIVMMTHKAFESELRSVISQLEALDVITSEIVCIRVEDLS